jgi:hypothetical protein
VVDAGLEGIVAKRLAEPGCSASVIASISGHTTVREVERYVKAADQERSATASCSIASPRLTAASCAERSTTPAGPKGYAR